MQPCSYIKALLEMKGVVAVGQMDSILVLSTPVTQVNKACKHTNLVVGQQRVLQALTAAKDGFLQPVRLIT